jgi:hypothetical protein
MKDLKGVSLRRAVTHKLDGFFAEWLKHLGTGTSRIWAQVEDALHKAAHPPATPRAPAPPEATEPPPVMRVPMQQQPLQQQQQKKEEK